MKMFYKWPTEAGPTDLQEQRYSGPPVGELDSTAAALYRNAADITARFWLNEQWQETFDAGNFEGCATLLHAERYLADRIGYELEPWPKGMMRVYVDQPDS